MNESSSNVKVILWPNGSTKDKISKININKSTINDLLSFKHLLLNVFHLNKYFTINTLDLYSSNGIRLDDIDIENLYSNQIIIYTNKSTPFSSATQYNLYTFISKIKSGGYGQVYYAQNVITNEYVAIKLVNCNDLSFDDIDTINREQLYMRNLKHKNIIKYRGFFKYDNKIYTIMDYAKGGELGKYVKEKGKLDEKEAKRIFYQIYKGVVYMHTNNLIHRDLKPNNILFLDENHEHVVIIDFGICGMSNGKNKDIIKAGTLEYLSPEIASGDEYESSPKIDVWSLGVILYFMLNGNLPFKGKNDKELIHNILYKEPDYKSMQKHLSEECICLLKGMLEKNVSLRCRMVDEEFNNWFNSNEKKEENINCKNVIIHHNIPRKKNNISLCNNRKKENISIKPNLEIQPFNYIYSLRGNISSTPSLLPKSPNHSNKNIIKLNKDFALFRKNEKKFKTISTNNNSNINHYNNNIISKHSIKSINNK